mmetsp:Transcript_26262/g.61718  ORF Transcript_26262/g.61718 Transcript_26262/m.61718 type:complete len:287 (-) Transcript_26262:60-920(-)
MLFALLLDPTRGGLEGRLAHEVHDGPRDGPLQLDVAGVKDPRAIRFRRVRFEVPVTGHVVEVAGLVVIEPPGQAVLGGIVLVVVIGRVSVAGNYVDRHLGFHGGGTVLVELRDVVLAGADFRYLSLVGIEIQNLRPHGFLGRVDVLNADRGPLDAIVSLGLLHYGLSVLEGLLVGFVQIDGIEGTRIVRGQHAAVDVGKVPVLPGVAAAGEEQEQRQERRRHRGRDPEGPRRRNQRAAGVRHGRRFGVCVCVCVSARRPSDTRWFFIRTGTTAADAGLPSRSVGTW